MKEYKVLSFLGKVKQLLRRSAPYWQIRELFDDNQHMTRTKEGEEIFLKVAAKAVMRERLKKSGFYQCARNMLAIKM